MTENDKSQVRAFLSTEAAKAWIDEGQNAYKEMALADAKSKDLYDVSLAEGKAWRDGIRHLVRIVQPQAIIENFGLSPIDTVRD